MEKYVRFGVSLYTEMSLKRESEDEKVQTKVKSWRFFCDYLLSFSQIGPQYIKKRVFKLFALENYEVSLSVCSFLRQ